MTASATAAAPMDYSEAVGREEEKAAVIGAFQVEALAATLDLPAAPREHLPPAWHWIFFNPFVRASELGPDGHPKRGGFLPAITLPRRMWAGGRLTYHAPIAIGGSATRRSRIAKVAVKEGASGTLVFVTVSHTISQNGAICIEEEQDLVYREAPAPDAPRPVPPPAPQNADWSAEIKPDPVLLFRYSALTSNGHRIHYDHPYATGEEGYPDLVVHGPLISTLLHGLAVHARPEARLTRFDFRATSPLFVGRPFHVEASAKGDSGLDLWARGPEGELAMRAEATFAA